MRREVPVQRMKVFEYGCRRFSHKINRLQYERPFSNRKTNVSRLIPSVSVPILKIR